MAEQIPAESVQSSHEEHPLLDLTELQRRQAAYDAEHWAHVPGDATIEHTLSHLAKLLGKLGTYVEATQHGKAPSREQIIGEVIPDLAIFAARLANSVEPDHIWSLSDLIDEREAELRKHFSRVTED